MTDKELNKLADLIANKVVKQIEEKQQEWDQNFIQDIEGFVSDSTMNIKYTFTDEITLLQQELNIITKEHDKAVNNEDYLKAEKYFKKMKILKDRISKLK